MDNKKVLSFRVADAMPEDVGLGYLRLDNEDMEKLDLIRKETRPEDQRGVAIFLTETGWEKAKRIRQVIYGIDDEMWQGIEPEARQQFMATFHRIMENEKKWGD